MAVGTLIPVPRIQFFDNDGVPLAGGKLEAYAAGTTTPQNTFTDAALTVPHANPVILDSAGRATIYLTPSLSYKFILKTSADVIIWTVDNVAPWESGVELVTGIPHNLLPDATASNRDIGSSTQRWNDLFISGTFNSTTPGGHGLGVTGPSNVALALGGTLVDGVEGLRAGTRLQPVVGANAGLITLSGGTIDEAASGSHAILAGILAAPFTVTAGGATVVEAATVYITAAPNASGAQNYALRVASGAFANAGVFEESALIVPAQITANQNDYNPTGIGTCRVAMLSSDASRNITGLAAQRGGRRILLINNGAQNIVLTHLDGASSATNQFVCPGSVSFTLNTNDSVEIWYDAVSFIRWRVLGF